jgi:hypothetical protein
VNPSFPLTVEKAPQEIRKGDMVLNHDRRLFARVTYASLATNEITGRIIGAAIQTEVSRPVLFLDGHTVTVAVDRAAAWAWNRHVIASNRADAS